MKVLCCMPYIIYMRAFILYIHTEVLDLVPGLIVSFEFLHQFLAGFNSSPFLGEPPPLVATPPPLKMGKLTTDLDPLKLNS